MLGLILSYLIGFDLPKTNIDYREFRCLSQSIYHEARGEPLDGQIMVANVIMNRVKHKEFPNTICDVVFQRNQFEWTQVVKRHNWTTNKNSDIITYMFLYGESLGLNMSINNATFFSVGGFRNNRLDYMFTIGGHKFYEIVN